MHKYADFSTKQRIFIDWLASGKYDQDPPTQRALAEKLGLNHNTLSLWKKGERYSWTEDEFKEVVIARARELNKDAIPTTYSSMRIEAAKGSLGHQKLLLELTGEYIPTEKRQVDVTVSKGYVSLGPEAWANDDEPQD